MGNYAFRSGGEELLAIVEPLWRELCAHHARIAPVFAGWFLERPFADRTADMTAHAQAGLHVQLVLVGEVAVGYCVCTLSAAGAGEIDSIYVRETHRGAGLGERLLRQALDWLEGRGAASIAVGVLHGNERALQWYARFGFLPRLVKMVRPGHPCDADPPGASA